MTKFNNHEQIALSSSYKWNPDCISIIEDNCLWIYNTSTENLINFLDLTKYPDLKLLLIDDIELISQLEKKGVIVQKDFDRFKSFYLTNRNNSALSFTIAPTMSCNLSCPYCFELKSSNSTISDLDCSSLCDFIFCKTVNHNNMCHISWYGGEPTIAIDKIENITKLLINKGIKINSTIITNGTLLNEDVIEKLKKNSITNIQISLDGTKQDHNKLRKYKNGTGSFDDIMTGISNLVKLTQIDITIRINCSIENIDRIVELMNLEEFPMPSNRITISLATIDSDNNYPLISKVIELKNIFENKKYVCSVPWNLSIYPFSCAVYNKNTYCIGPKLEMYECYSDFGHIDRIVGSIINSQLERKNGKYENCAPQEKCINCKILQICATESCPYRVNFGYLISNSEYCNIMIKSVYQQIEKKIVIAKNGGQK